MFNQSLFLFLVFVFVFQFLRALAKVAFRVSDDYPKKAKTWCANLLIIMMCCMPGKFLNLDLLFDLVPSRFPN